MTMKGCRSRATCLVSGCRRGGCGSCRRAASPRAATGSCRRGGSATCPVAGCRRASTCCGRSYGCLRAANVICRRAASGLGPGGLSSSWSHNPCLYRRRGFDHARGACLRQRSITRSCVITAFGLQHAHGDSRTSVLYLRMRAQRGASRLAPWCNRAEGSGVGWTRLRAAQRTRAESKRLPKKKFHVQIQLDRLHTTHLTSPS